MLRHTALPFIAFARPHVNGDVMVTCVDHPDLAAALTTLTDTQALTAAQLQTSLSHADLSDLSPHEHDQINYWKPTVSANCCSTSGTEHH
ncbi:hypothetical protein [Micromonospora sp. KC723]|uniref:hypothetical protein n=1 Tax=Micromonospora sp. KC723 TaxID=2530381 RepID=UPI001FB82FC2|nr:hypothetical protein [Micromonospora sp. KC723]